MRLSPVAPLPVALALAGCGGGGGSTQSKGFLDHIRLEKDIQTTLDKKLSDDPSSMNAQPGTTVESVQCLPNGGRRFVCGLVFSSGEKANLKVLVSPDGKTYLNEATTAE
jgi:hypothetical protein